MIGPECARLETERISGRRRQDIVFRPDADRFQRLPGNSGLCNGGI